MRLINIIILLIIMSFSTTIFSQTNNHLEDWMKIKVFISTRDDVEKLFDNPTNSEDRISDGKRNPVYFRRYDLSNATASVFYSEGDCKIDNSRWNSPEWTVTEIVYTPVEGLVKLKNLIPDKSQFKTKQEGDVVGHIVYYNDEKGIAITYDKEIKEVLHIRFYPSLKDRRSRECDLIEKEEKN